MSLSPTLLASARAAYRDLLRASAVSFAGDDVVRNAFKLKMRSEVMLPLTAEGPLFEEKVKLAREIATVLRQNIVQGVKIEGSTENGEARWRLRITKDTELGSNDSIKSPPPMQSSRSARKRQPSPPTDDSASTTLSNNNIPRYYSQLKKAHQQRKVPELREEDLEESFVRGSGPGGQSINKTENNVQLVHKPTGIRVTCQETRSLGQNRKLARRRLLQKLDELYNPGLSKEALLQAKQNERERRRRKKAKKKAQQKQQESQEAFDDDLE